MYTSWRKKRTHLVSVTVSLIQIKSIANLKARKTSFVHMLFHKRRSIPKLCTKYVLSFSGRKLKKILRQQSILWAKEILWEFNSRQAPGHWWSHSLGTGLRNGFYGNLVVQCRLEDFTGQLQWKGVYSSFSLTTVLYDRLCQRLLRNTSLAINTFINTLCVMSCDAFGQEQWVLLELTLEI